MSGYLPPIQPNVSQSIPQPGVNSEEDDRNVNAATPLNAPAGLKRRAASFEEGGSGVRNRGTQRLKKLASRDATPTTSASVATTNEPTSWPSCSVDTSTLNGAANAAKNRARPARAALATSGREQPALNCQTVGHYWPKPVGAWPGDRGQLGARVVDNLKKLGTLDTGTDQAKQLRREITLHWHCLSAAEKSDVLDETGSSPFVGKPNVQAWLEHTAAHMNAEDAQQLHAACGGTARSALQRPFVEAATDDGRRAAIKENSADMRMTLPLDHMYDYTGFYWSNDRKIGALPKDVADGLKVVVIGAGPSGLMAADCLNRIGVKPTVLEADDHIGGRLATHRRKLDGEGDGALSPTTTHPGGMRFHTTHGNFYWSFAQHYGLDHIDFPNPSRVGATLILGDKVLKMEPGKASEDPTLEKVKADFNKAMDSLTQPIRDARDAGDTARFRELCDDAKKTFDPLDFRQGVEHLLEKNGVKWTEDEWDTFGAVGIGVGGYKGYYSTGFLEEWRFLVDERLEGHQLLVDGADEPLRRMVKDNKGVAQSLDEQNAIQLNSEVTDVERLKSGGYKVTWSGPNGNVSKEFDEVFFAAGPAIAKKLKMTEPQEGREPLVSAGIAQALNGANIVGATKMTMTVPVDDFHPEKLPKNLQSTAAFQQLYLHAPSKPGNNAVVYLSYTLGDNAKKVENETRDDQIDQLLSTLNDAATKTDAKTSSELTELAKLIDKYRDRSHYTHWTNVPTQGGAFKMDAPSDLDNTRALFAQTLQPRDEPYFINEEVTAEGGFASGALAAAVNAVSSMIVQRGGKLETNGPLEQVVL